MIDDIVETARVTVTVVDSLQASFSNIDSGGGGGVKEIKNKQNIYFLKLSQ